MIYLDNAGVTIRNREHLLIVLQKLKKLGCYWIISSDEPEELKATQFIPTNCISLRIINKRLAYSDEFHHFSGNDITEKLDNMITNPYKHVFYD